MASEDDIVQTIRIETKGADKAQKDLERIGEAGEKAIADIEKAAGKDVFDKLAKDGQEAFKRTAESGKQALEEVGDAGDGMFDKIGKSGEDEFKKAGAAGKEAMKGVEEAGSAAFDAIGDHGKSIFDELVAGIAKGVGSALGKDLFDKFKQDGLSTFTQLAEAGKGAFEAIKSSGDSEVFDKIKEAASKAFSGVADDGKTSIEKIKETVEKSAPNPLFDKIGDAAKKAFEGIGGGAKSLGDKVKDAFKGMGDGGIFDRLGKAATSAFDTIASAVKTAGASFAGLASAAKTAGTFIKDLFEGTAIGAAAGATGKVVGLAASLIGLTGLLPAVSAGLGSVAAAMGAFSIAATVANAAAALFTSTMARLKAVLAVVGIATVAAVAAVGLTGAAFFKMAEGAAKAIEKTNDAAEELNVSVEQFKGMRDAFASAGVGADKVLPALKKMQSGIDKVWDKAEDEVEKSAQKQIDAVQKVEDAFEKVEEARNKAAKVRRDPKANQDQLRNAQRAVRDAERALKDATVEREEARKDDIIEITKAVKDLQAGDVSALERINATTENLTKGIVLSAGVGREALKGLADGFSDLDKPNVVEGMRSAAAAIIQIDDAAKRNKLSNDILGISYQKLVEIMSQPGGIDAFIEKQNQAAEANRRAAGIASAFTASLERLKNELSDLGSGMGIEFAPGFTKAFEAVTGAINATKTTWAELVRVLAKPINMAVEALGVSLATVIVVAGQLVAAILDVGKALDALKSGDFSAFFAKLTDALKRMETIKPFDMEASLKAIEALNKEIRLREDAARKARGEPSAAEEEEAKRRVLAEKAAQEVEPKPPEPPTTEIKVRRGGREPQIEKLPDLRPEVQEKFKKDLEKYEADKAVWDAKRAALAATAADIKKEPKEPTAPTKDVTVRGGDRREPRTVQVPDTSAEAQERLRKQQEEFAKAQAAKAESEARIEKEKARIQGDTAATEKPQTAEDTIKKIGDQMRPFFLPKDFGPVGDVIADAFAKKFGEISDAIKSKLGIEGGAAGEAQGPLSRRLQEQREAAEAAKKAAEPPAATPPPAESLKPPAATKEDEEEEESSLRDLTRSFAAAKEAVTGFAAELLGIRPAQAAERPPALEQVTPDTAAASTALTTLQTQIDAVASSFGKLTEPLDRLMPALNAIATAAELAAPSLTAVATPADDLASALRVVASAAVSAAAALAAVRAPAGPAQSPPAVPPPAAAGGEQADAATRMTLTAASGGFISGPGGPRSDSILARLSNGEFVINARATKHWGIDLLGALNKMRMPQFSAGGVAGLLSPTLPTLPRFASGGAITTETSPQSLGTVDLRTDHGSVTVHADNGTARQLQRLAVQKRMTATGRKPNFVS